MPLKRHLEQPFLEAFNNLRDDHNWGWHALERAHHACSSSRSRTDHSRYRIGFRGQRVKAMSGRD
jgi:hypothetical protein